MRNIVILISGGGSNMAAIVRAAGRDRWSERFGARIAAVVSNKAEADGLALAQSHGELHPVIGLWPVALAEDLEEQLGKGVRKVLHWTDRHGTVAVPFRPARVCGLDIDPFFNANTPQELDQLRAMLAKTAKTSK